MQPAAVVIADSLECGRYESFFTQSYNDLMPQIISDMSGKTLSMNEAFIFIRHCHSSFLPVFQGFQEDV